MASIVHRSLPVAAALLAGAALACGPSPTP
jgi:hypothetical protein